MAILQVVVTFLAAREIGRLIARKCGWDFSHPALQGAVEAAVGLIVVSYSIFGVVLLGQAGSRASWFFLLAGAVVGVVLPGIRGRFSALLQLSQQPMSVWLLSGAFVLYGIWIALQTALPPIGIDELTYHLAVPKALLESGGEQWFQDNVYAYFPQLVDMFFVLGLPLGGEMAAKLFHAGFLLLIAAALFGYARSFMETNYAALTVAAFLSIPSVMFIAGLAYVDLAFTLYCFLAVIGLIRLMKAPCFGWAAFTGVMVGGAWCIKYTGLQLLLLLDLVFLLDSLISKRRVYSGSYLVGPMVAGLLVAPYLIRNWLITGWPLFPFNIGPFNLVSAINWDLERSRLFLAWLAGFGGGEGTLLDAVLAPVLVFIRGRFGDLHFYDGILGLVFLLVPFLLIRAKRTREVRLFMLFSIAFLVYWSITTRQVRFLLPAVAGLCFLLSWGAAHWKSPALNAVVLVLIGWNLLSGIQYQSTFNPSQYWFGLEGRETFLAKRIRGYSIYETANQQVAENDRLYLVNMGNFVYLLDCNWRSDFVFEYFRLGRELEKAKVPADLLDFFRGQKVSHLLINEGLTLSTVFLPERELNLLAQFLKEYTSVIATDPADSGQVLRRVHFD
ncbi:MAG: hypothetical protein JSU96_00055 [Acidobacteriota bacterium]|nr:MAG: hypothetical protein JSU96_00055 [Acidobacteriota bacterium]